MSVPPEPDAGWLDPAVVGGAVVAAGAPVAGFVVAAGLVVAFGLVVFGLVVGFLVAAPTGIAGLCWYEGEFELAKAAAKAGVPFEEILPEGEDIERLLLPLSAVLVRSEGSSTGIPTPPSPRPSGLPDTLVVGTGLDAVMAQVAHVAPTDAPVLILGNEDSRQRTADRLLRLARGRGGTVILVEASER
mgnify:CR=1 FL=1